MHAMNLGWGLGRTEEAAEMIIMPVARAVFLFFAGKYDDARALLSPADPGEAAILAMIDVVQGRYTGSFPVVPPNPEVGLGAEMNLFSEVFVYSMHGELARAERLAVQAHREKAEWDSMRSIWAVSCAGLARAGGRLLEARRLLREARPTQPFVRLCELAHVEALLGNDARALLAEAEALAPPGMRPYGIGLWQARIWAGGTSPFEAAEDARTHCEFAAEAIFLHEAVRLGHASEALERLRELAATTTGLLVPVYAAHAEALVRNDSTALEEVRAVRGSRIPAVRGGSRRRVGQPRAGRPADRPVRGSANAGARPDDVGAAHQAGTRDRRAGRTGTHEQGDRRLAGDLRADRRQPPVQHVREARDHDPRRTRAGPWGPGITLGVVAAAQVFGIEFGS